MSGFFLVIGCYCLLVHVLSPEQQKKGFIFIFEKILPSELILKQHPVSKAVNKLLAKLETI